MQKKIDCGFWIFNYIKHISFLFEIAFDKSIDFLGKQIPFLNTLKLIFVFLSTWKSVL